MRHDVGHGVARRSGRGLPWRCGVRVCLPDQEPQDLDRPVSVPRWARPSGDDEPVCRGCARRPAIMPVPMHEAKTERSSSRHVSQPVGAAHRLIFGVRRVRVSLLHLVLVSEARYPVCGGTRDDLCSAWRPPLAQTGFEKSRLTRLVDIGWSVVDRFVWDACVQWARPPPVRSPEKFRMKWSYPRISIYWHNKGDRDETVFSGGRLPARCRICDGRPKCDDWPAGRYLPIDPPQRRVHAHAQFGPRRANSARAVRSSRSVWKSTSRSPWAAPTRSR